MPSKIEPAAATQATVTKVQTVSAPKELNALSLVWAMISNFFASLFGRKT